MESSTEFNLSIPVQMIARRDDFAGSWMIGGDVAQISNLLFRRLAVGRPFGSRDGSGFEIRDTAGWKPALLSLRLGRAAYYAAIF